MGFLAPSLLLGLLAAALPWLIHLIGKRRAVPVRFAAMQLLLRSERRISARRRLREILLLVARTSIAAALPLIFAQPFTERVADLPPESLSAQSAVILLDDSASMRRSTDDGTVFERGQERARTLLQQLPNDAEVAFLTVSEKEAADVSELTLERGRLREAVDGARATARGVDYGQALRRAALVLGTSRRAERRIFLITDLQASGWRPEVLSMPQADHGGLVLLDVGGEGQWLNRAVIGLLAQPASDTIAGAVTVKAEIADFTGKPHQNLGVTLRIDGAVVTKSFIELPANGRQTKTFFHTLPSGGGAHDVEVSIDNDDFPLDDRRLARLELSRALRVLIINGDARTVIREDEAFFLETALRATDRTTQVTTALPDDVSAGTLANYNVVFLANVAEPAPALAASLRRFVERGGGLFLSVGGRVNPLVWNERLAELLPQPLSQPRTASAIPGQVVGEILDDRPPERLAPLDRRHPLLANFPARGEGLAMARFFKFMLLEPVPETAGAQIILRYESGAPALVEKELGKGRVMLLSTTVDREWTDLPIRSGFLPLAHESARRLAGTSDREGSSVLTVGDRRQLALGPDETRLEVTKPDGTVWVANKPRGAAARTVAFTETDEPGPYQVKLAGPDGSLEAVAAEGFVVNLDPGESNPVKLDPKIRPDQPAAAKKTGEPPVEQVELWHAIAALLIALVLLESLLTLRWRRPVVAEDRLVGQGR